MKHDTNIPTKSTRSETRSNKHGNRHEHLRPPLYQNSIRWMFRLLSSNNHNHL